MNRTPDETALKGGEHVQGDESSPSSPWGNGTRPPEDIEKRFRELVDAWKAESLVLSSVTAMMSLPSYQQIIALGQPVVPLLLRELEQRPDHWFGALKALTGADPVPVVSRGRVREMAQAWVRWGREQGYSW